MKESIYRTDIDGLRAIAVIAVIVFHAVPESLSGGFVGVDIFFVISGYLITQRIVAGYTRGNFSYINFYIRRARRLLPAVFSTVSATIIAGCLLLHPQELTVLARSSIAAVFSLANIYFFMEAGYWDLSSWQKPLLHTWSLGVEEQFYMFWPLFILLILKLPKKGSAYTIVVITILSLCLTAYVTPVKPNAAFYLTPFRIYEFGIGAACVWLDQIDWGRNLVLKLVQYALFGIGLSVILLSVARIDESMVFPGWLAAVPALGTALVIVARNPSGLTVLLANPAMRYIGLISYSLYLVHWPVLVFLKYEYGELKNATLVLGVVLTFILSALQYRFIETPLRYPAIENNKVKGAKLGLKVFGCFTIAAGLISVVAGAIIYTGGFPGRYDANLQRYVNVSVDQINVERFSARNDLCKIDKIGTICGRIIPSEANVLVVGDSHGPDGLNIFRAAFPDVNYLIASKGGCPLLTSLEKVEHSYRGCGEYNDYRLEDIERIAVNLDYIVISNRMGLHRAEATIETVSWLSELELPAIVLGAGPQFISDLLPRVLQYGSVDHIDNAMKPFTETSHFAIDDILESRIHQMGGKYVRKLNFFCPDSVCRILTDDGALVVVDEHHLTIEASQDFGRFLSSSYEFNLFD